MTDVPALQTYRRVLLRPGVRSLVVTTLLARVPITAAPLVLVLHVVSTLHLGYTESGLVAACAGAGAALGAPLVGRGLDRFGVRPVLAVTALGEAVAWAGAAVLPYHWLLPDAFAGGLLSLPVFTLARQSLAALLPSAERTTGFALDSISVELSYMVGPALGVLAATRLGTRESLLLVAAVTVLVGLALGVLDPPVRPARDDADGDPMPAGTATRVRWWRSGAMGVLVATAGATVSLAGTDTAITALMRDLGDVGLIGAVIAVWCLASVVGGFVYGARGRPIDPAVLLTGLAGFTLLLAPAPTWWALGLLCIPSGVFCAPLISASAERLTRITPAERRGQVMGVHASALTVGNALGAPFAGAAVDRFGPPAGFLGVGLAGLVLAALAAGIGATSGRGRLRGPAPDEAGRTAIAGV